MADNNILYLIGYASGLAGANTHVAEGPLALQKSSYLYHQGIPIQWDAMLIPPRVISASIDVTVRQLCLLLAKRVSTLVQANKRCCVVGGDHTAAIGTWSGVYDALHKRGDLGLIWLDAHMDSHTPQTTESGYIHGMPLASLLGYGYPTLTSVLHAAPKLKPSNVCLIGVRSFERGEAELLHRLQVRVYYMEEVKQRGFLAILREAVNYVNRKTLGYGLTIDIDSLDPQEAPGVDVPEVDGLHVQDLYSGLSEIAADPRLIATEIVEFDPCVDKNHLTEKVVATCLSIFAKPPRVE